MRPTQFKNWGHHGTRRALTELEKEILRNGPGKWRAREALRDHLNVKAVDLSSDPDEREDQIDRLARGLS